MTDDDIEYFELRDGDDEIGYSGRTAPTAAGRLLDEGACQ
jgi:hypothetical protein